MSEVQAIYDNWGNRASLLEPAVTGNGSRTFKVGGYTITVPDSADEPAKVAHEYRSWGRSENPMPNMSFSDGEMRIPVEDFADLILRRVPAVELAEGLWRDDEVRERFVECMASRYGGDGIEDKDRRSLLNQVQVAIHAVAIDRAIEKLNGAESVVRAHANNLRWRMAELGHYNGLYERYKLTLMEMREAGLLDDAAIAKRLELLTTPENLKAWSVDCVDPVVVESVGTSWYESRDFWRNWLSANFIAPSEPNEPAHPTPSASPQTSANPAPH